MRRELPEAGLNALANLTNAANLQHWPLTIVLIGMNKLPLTIKRLPQVDRRVVDTIFFEPYTPEQALHALREIHPFFRSLDLLAPEGQKTMDFLTSPEVSRGGMLGLMIQLVRATARHCAIDGQEFSLMEMRMQHGLTASDVKQAVASAKDDWRTPGPKADSAKTGARSTREPAGAS